MDNELSEIVIFDDATATAIGLVTTKIGPVSEESYQEIMWVITRFIQGVVALSQEANPPGAAHGNPTAATWQNAAQAWMSVNVDAVDRLVHDHRHEISLHGVPQELPLDQPLKLLAFVAVLQTMMAVARLREVETQ